VQELAEVAPAFVEMAHRIVWCSAATVDAAGRPWSRVLHPIWEWDGEQLVGWIATGPTPLKRTHLAAHPYVSLSYWDASHDTCGAECGATWADDPDTQIAVWQKFESAPPPVGYDPAIIPPWRDGPQSPAFGALRLEPWRVRVMPGTVMTAGTGGVLTWSARPTNP
jgi:hypothetical protein